jgi:hypothetical protein
LFWLFSYRVLVCVVSMESKDEWRNMEFALVGILAEEQGRTASDTTIPLDMHRFNIGILIFIPKW